jgi:hypothetical protein
MRTFKFIFLFYRMLLVNLHACFVLVVVLRFHLLHTHTRTHARRRVLAHAHTHIYYLKRESLPVSSSFMFVNI